MSVLDAPRDRVLAIDYGERRIGLALADPGQALVRGLPTIDLGDRREDPVPAIARLVRDQAVDRIVLGIPYTMAGEEGPQAAAVRSFQARLEQAIAVPIEEWDERLTTEAARRRLRDMGYDERETRARADQLSAVLMLEAWLQRRAWVDASSPPDPSNDPPSDPPPTDPAPVGPRVVIERARRKPGRGWSRRLPLVAFAFAIAAAAGVAWTARAPSDDPAPVRVAIEPGTTVRAIAHELDAKGVVRSALLLEGWLRLRGDTGRIQAGTYELRRDRTLFAVADQLVAGGTMLASVTIPEGLRLDETAEVAARMLAVDSAAFVAAAIDTALADSLLPRSLVGGDPATLEGYLFPETYRVDPAIDARGLARVMVGQFWTTFGPRWRARADSLGTTIHEIVTLASIVEEEAKVPEERTVIAGVFWNRLRRGMALEADPTIQYALGGHRARVLYRDLEVDSPYNTYRRAGLPPGPIASPGRDVLEATLYPDSVPYLYFFATGDGGRHTFSETYSEHLRKRRELGR